MYTLEKRQEIKEHSYNIVIGFYILKTKKAGETKRRNQGEERHPDKQNERIKNTKKKIVYFSSLVCCSHFALARE